MSFDGTAPSYQNDRLHWTNIQGGLQQLASETGGKALLNSNDLADLLEDVTEQLVSTYSLGFSPDERRSGEVRRLKVELAPHAAQGRRVEYRRSYRDKTQDEQLAERLISAAYLGSTPNALGVAVDLGATTPREKKVHRQPVSIVVPEDAVLLVPGAGGPGGRLRLLLLAVDEEKRGRTSVRQMTVPVGPAGDVQATDGAFRFEVSVSLARGRLPGRRRRPGRDDGRDVPGPRRGEGPVAVASGYSRTRLSPQGTTSTLVQALSGKQYE